VANHELEYIYRIVKLGEGYLTIIQESIHSIESYFELGLKPGSCFMAMLRNDLFRAAGSLHPASKRVFINTVLYIFTKYSGMDPSKHTDVTKWMIDPDRIYTDYFKHAFMVNSLSSIYNSKEPMGYAELEKIVIKYITDGTCSDFLRTVLSGDMIMACICAWENSISSEDLVDLVHIISYSVPSCARRNVDDWINDVDNMRTSYHGFTYRYD